MFRKYELIILDASNIARHQCSSKTELGHFQNVQIVFEGIRLIKSNIEIMSIADANLQYHVADLDLLLHYLHQKKLILAPAGTDADEFILKLAHCNPKAAIISNDQYKNYNGKYNKVKQRRIPFMILNNQVFFFEGIGNGPSRSPNKPRKRRKPQKVTIRCSYCGYSEKMSPAVASEVLFCVNCGNRREDSDIMEGK